MKKNLILSIIIVLCLLTSGNNTVYAKDSKCSVNEVLSFAISSVELFPTTSNWHNNEVVNLIPLYDIEDTICAYLVEIYNKDTNNYAYMTILVSGDEPIILEYHPNSRFIFSNEDKIYYNGMLNYYVNDEDGLLRNFTPVSCGYNSQQLHGNPDMGSSSNPLSVYQSHIDFGIPVVVMMESLPSTSPYYSSTAGHTACGTGYYTGGTGNFIIVHTTYHEGDVYLAFSPSAIGQHAWFVVY